MPRAEVRQQISWGHLSIEKEFCHNLKRGQYKTIKIAETLANCNNDKGEGGGGVAFTKRTKPLKAWQNVRQWGNLPVARLRSVPLRRILTGSHYKGIRVELPIHFATTMCAQTNWHETRRK